MLSNEDLYGLLGSLPGANVGGSKPERLERIVDDFDRMVFRDVPAAHAAARLKIESGTDTDVADQGERADVQPGGVQYHGGAG